MKQSHLWSLAALFAGAALVSVVWTAAQPAAPTWPGDTKAEAPDFELQTIEGDTFRLSEHRGDVVVLNFWATWCPPCLREIPGFVEMQTDLGPEGLTFVGVALERNPNDVETVRSFADRLNVNYPVGLGDGSITQKYGGVPSLPTTVVIGKEGRIRGRIPGLATEQMMRPGLEKLLDE